VSTKTAHITAQLMITIWRLLCEGSREMPSASFARFVKDPKSALASLVYRGNRWDDLADALDILKEAGYIKYQRRAMGDGPPAIALLQFHLAEDFLRSLPYGGDKKTLKATVYPRDLPETQFLGGTWSPVVMPEDPEDDDALEDAGSDAGDDELSLWAFPVSIRPPNVSQKGNGARGEIEFPQALPIRAPIHVDNGEERTGVCQGGAELSPNGAVSEDERATLPTSEADIGLSRREKTNHALRVKKVHFGWASRIRMFKGLWRHAESVPGNARPCTFNPVAVLAGEGFKSKTTYALLRIMEEEDGCLLRKCAKRPHGGRDIIAAVELLVEEETYISVLEEQVRAKNAERQKRINCAVDILKRNMKGTDETSGLPFVDCAYRILMNEGIPKNSVQGIRGNLKKLGYIRTSKNPGGPNSPNGGLRFLLLPKCFER